jgi:VIT1/CCC1 family predicted Fe2+/Mn2+ transporter
VDTCWFCERRAAAADTALRATVYGNVKDPPPAAGRNIELHSDAARVTLPIARCSSCASLQRRERAITLAGLGLGVVLLTVPYAFAAYGRNAPPFEVFGGITATLVTLAIAGFILGLASGALVAGRVNRGMPRRDVRGHPDVLALTAAGWSYDPPSVD